MNRELALWIGGGAITAVLVGLIVFIAWVEGARFATVLSVATLAFVAVVVAGAVLLSYGLTGAWPW